MARAQAQKIFAARLDGRDPAEEKSALDTLCGVADWRHHDLRRTLVSGMARLGIPPHVADKILNHQAGTISGVASVSKA
jgi:hypothetical protein